MARERRYWSRQPAGLESVRSCRHPGVVARFCATFAVERDEAERLYSDLLTWLWVHARARHDHEVRRIAGPGRLVMTPALLILSEMWQVFLLFTADYAEFCETFLGGMIHHEPERAAAPDLRARLSSQINAAAELVGFAWVRRVYVELPVLYPPERVAELHRYGRLTQSRAAKA